MHAKRNERPLVLGLTGSVGMGKSTVARMLTRQGVPVFDADKAVHGLLARGGAGVDKVAWAFPLSLKRGAIDRRLLGYEVFGAPAKRKKLERILHPLVKTAQDAFIQKHRRAKIVALEIPLLFETGWDKACDVTLCVTAPREIQKTRVMSRAGMTTAKFRAILKAQMPDAEKRRRATFVLDTRKGLVDTRQSVKAFLTTLHKEHNAHA